MTAKELRIGNLLMCKEISKYPIPVSDIWSDGTVHFDWESMEGQTGAPIDRCESIALTEEWLLRFGWVWNEECKSYEKHGDARMNLQYRDVNSSYTMFNYVLKATIAERIYFVHQLQNLYFALTGEELKIQTA